MIHSPYFLPVALLASYIATIGLTALARHLLMRYAIMDQPNARSMHAAPVPRGGGWAILMTLLAGLAIILQGSLLEPPALWILAAVALLAGVSWLDDRRHVNVVIRLGAHIAAAYMGSLALPHEAFLTKGLLPFWADRLILIVGWAWFINLSNFMDGIDGIAISETISLVTGCALLFGILLHHDPFIIALQTLLLGACCGFLTFNWHPAKIFLGDVGSVPLGFLTGFLLLQAAALGHTLAALILPLYYLADSGITIARRILNKEKFWQPHRQHFYQRAALGIACHDKVVLWIQGANLALIAASLIAVTHGCAGFGLAVTVVALLLAKMHKSAPQ